jgi:hypothetical protein
MHNDCETLKFKVGLSGTYWDRLPEFTISIDDQQYISGTAGKDIQYYEFDALVAENCSHQLRIRLENKSDSDVVQNEDQTQILKDMLLNIESISIDDLDLGILLWHGSKFVGDDPSRPTIDGCVNLGWNGTYILDFSSPFYLWLLEKM